MVKLISHFFITSSLVLITACSFTPILPGADKIRIVNYESALTKCTYLGEVLSVEGNIVSYWFTTNPNLVQGSLNQFRNKALEMGGNTIVYMDEPEFNTSVAFVGHVYKCDQ